MVLHKRGLRKLSTLLTALHREGRRSEALVAGRPSLPGGPRWRPSWPGPSLPGGPRCREALVAGTPSLGGLRCREACCREALAGRPLPDAVLHKRSLRKLSTLLTALHREDDEGAESLPQRALGPGSAVGKPWSFVKEAYVSFRPLWVLTGPFGSPYGEGTLRRRPLTGGLYSPSERRTTKWLVLQKLVQQPQIRGPS